MNKYIIFDFLSLIPELTILQLGNNLTTNQYHGIYLKNKVHVYNSDPGYRLAIDYFKHNQILHIKKRLPILSVVDQNHFHYDGFYGACFGGHFELIGWIWKMNKPSFSMGYRGATKADRQDVIKYLEHLLEEKIKANKLSN